jgi:putative tryptophan/tyrosine transport system substrate-binding protein
MKKLDLSILVAALVLTVTLGANAQQAAKVPRIGYLAGGTPDDEKERVAAFQQGLRDLSYVDGKNILVEYRYADGNLDAIKGLVTELMQLKIDVLVSGNFASIRAAKEAIKTIPIVVITAQNPVETGLVESLAHPGGNITGLTTLNRELSGKRLELLKEVIPKLLRVGAIWEVAAPGAGVAFKEYDAAARALKIELQPLKVQGPNPDLEGAFKAAVTGRANALIPIRSTLMGHYRKRIADLAIKNRLPSMNERSEWVEAGGLLSYTASEAESFRRAATYVDKILKGAKPADLPVEQAMKFEFIINLKTAKQIGLTIPPNVLVRADKVIK